MIFVFIEFDIHYIIKPSRLRASKVNRKLELNGAYQLHFLT
ncbi:hypothetical protein C900_01091 [Fulvivirga imtechensis AK7]|uniref:Uncharacterized protein n=1 Tax=Fulvivirga imtechensis AK7 TaxID=1237149 RepID=L8JZT5_9BACT|nr:hypothetical protein C900_01091 [Fulvivirga imtechensis AK7]